MKASLLVYDIPERCNCPNPSPRLRRIGVRINLSCWVIPTDCIPWVLLHHMADAGATWHVVGFDPAEGRQLIELAVAALRREVTACVDRLRASVQASERRTGTGHATAQEISRYRQTTAAACRRARHLLDGCQEVARLFKIPIGDVSDPVGHTLPGALVVIEAIQRACHVRAQLYADYAAQVQGTRLGAAARDSQVPPGVLADFTEDELGLDATGLRAAFEEDTEDE